jgi:hypothetical protein
LRAWQNYVHYLLLTIVIAVFAHYNGIHAFHTPGFFPNTNFFLLYSTIFIADTLIHWIFANLPKKYRWED